MKIVFMGTPDFSVPILRGLVTDGWQVPLVVTQPDRPKGRKKTMTPPPVKEEAQRLGIDVYQPEKIADRDAAARVLETEPDIIVTAAFGQILPRAILDAPPHGCINVHASLLPKYRGGAPIHRSVINGENEAGITIMYMVEKLDAGAMLSRQSIPIEAEDTAGSMHDKLSVLGKDLLLETLPKLINGEINPEEQDEQQATFAPNIKKEDERLNWSKPAAAVYNQIRGLSPWPVAYTTVNGERIKIWQASLLDAAAEKEPGTVTAAGPDGIDVVCGDGRQVRLLTLQPAGKNQMNAETFLNGKGSTWEIGMKLGEN
ncbi:methionyl-tRNA formyltransferase [Salisediminibacterium halotolerans]|nr:methionyl-tRNA formyltransferase [Actinophytocola xinjiangensis]RPE87633.1 methionyl-tRNA formyltransferase [Salisediminibacterium halotolerans]TWG35112.1 methionyl-tRNA formyltransferase [Salisediminibacterium halotolerans]GEL06840.1 methionyl-tRNA formyltransferase [Salisediminibacterium halotolerans]